MAVAGQNDGDFGPIRIGVNHIQASQKWSRFLLVFGDVWIGFAKRQNLVVKKRETWIGMNEELASLNVIICGENGNFSSGSVSDDDALCLLTYTQVEDLSAPEEDLSG